MIMRILGIDPGIGRAGWGIIEKEKSSLQVGRYGCIETSQKLSLEQRLFALHKQVVTIIEEEKPTEMAIEELFFNTNVTTAFTVGQARGVVLLAAAQYNLPVYAYTPLQVKMGVTGYGKADKAQVGQMVKTQLRLSTIPKPDDTTDALAIAITHAFTAKMLK